MLAGPRGSDKDFRADPRPLAGRCSGLPGATRGFRSAQSLEMRLFHGSELQDLRTPAEFVYVCILFCFVLFCFFPVVFKCWKKAKILKLFPGEPEASLVPGHRPLARPRKECDGASLRSQVPACLVSTPHPVSSTGHGHLGQAWLLSTALRGHVSRCPRIGSSYT